MMKILTISIASYNVEKCLKNAIRSCLNINENLKNQLEIIVINDGSKDNTLNVANEYAKKYPSIVHVIDKENGGYGSTVNASLEITTGKYLKLLDADDEFDSKELEKHIAYLNNTNADLVITDYILKMPNKKVFIHGLENLMYGKYDISNLSRKLEMHACTYKTEILKKANFKLDEKIFYTDTEYVVYPLYYCSNVEYHDCCLYQYSLGDDGQTVSKSSRIKNYKDAKIVFLNLVADYTSKKKEKLVNQIVLDKLCNAYFFALQSMILGNKKKEAFEFDEYVRNKLPEVYNGGPSMYGFSQKLYRRNKKMFFWLYRNRLNKLL